MRGESQKKQVGGEREREREKGAFTTVQYYK